MLVGRLGALGLENVCCSSPSARAADPSRRARRLEEQEGGDGTVD